MTFAQHDTLITKKGRIYFGKIVNDDSKYIQFQPQNWTSITKISYNKIGKLITRDGVVLIQNNFKPKEIANDTKFIHSSLNIEEKAIYDAKKNAIRWIAYPILSIPISGGLATATFFIFENIFGAPDEAALAIATIGGGSLGLIGSHNLFRKLDKKNTGNTGIENIELYERIYIEDYKKEKLKNIVIGSGILGLTAVVVLHFIFRDFMTDYDPYFGP